MFVKSTDDTKYSTEQEVKQDSWLKFSCKINPNI